MGIIGILLPQQLTSVFLAVYLDNAAVGFLGEKQLGHTGNNAGVKNPPYQCKNEKNRQCFRKNRFQFFHDHIPPLHQTDHDQQDIDQLHKDERGNQTAQTINEQVP